MRILAITVVLVLGLAASARAQVTVVRAGEENPVVTIAKSTFWGGVTGLVLGGATALIVDNHRGDVLKWFFVGGTFGGFGFGVYHVLTREHPSSALLQIDDDGSSFGMPTLMLSRSDTSSQSVYVNLVSLKF
jgi:hypothetical protein